MNLTDILQAHRSIVRVEVEKSKDAQAFWNQLRDEVYKILRDSKVYYAMDTFPSEDQLELVNKSGRILKRFAAHYTSRESTRLDSDTLGKIGDKLQYFVSNEATSYFLDFTDKIDWEDGQFGHEGSCWWNSYGDSIPTFQKNGGWAVRFYNSEVQHYDNGIGRTWILPHDNTLLCFNSYGVERPNVSKAIKKVFANHDIALHYKVAEIESANSTIPYINSGSGFVLYPEGADLPQDRIILNLKVYRVLRCADCNKIVSEKDFNMDGFFYCESCHEHNFSHCAGCEREMRNFNFVSIKGHEGKYCYNCRKSMNAKECYYCDHWATDTVESKEHQYICPDCLPRACSCSNCHNIFVSKRECHCVAHRQEYRDVIKQFSVKNVDFHFYGLPWRPRDVLVNESVPCLAIVRVGSEYRIFHRGGAMVKGGLTKTQAVLCVNRMCSIDWTKSVRELRDTYGFFSTLENIYREVL